MTDATEWSPDEPSGTEVFEQGDEALDDAEGLDPAFLEDVELDPSLDPTLAADDRELTEVGAEFDDPERIATLDGGIDDPDGVGGQLRDDDPVRTGEDEAWDLDAAEGSGDEPDDAD